MPATGDGAHWPPLRWSSIEGQSAPRFTDLVSSALGPEPEGLLFCETLSWEHAEATGFRRAFCLEPGELLGAFEGPEVLAHEEGELEGRFRESLLARRSRHLHSS